MRTRAADPAFERALAAEVIESEQIRIRALAAVLTVLLILDELLFIFGQDFLRQFLRAPVPPWQPLGVIGPFLAYEIVVLVVLRYLSSRGKDLPTLGRFANVLIETSLPTVILWWGNRYAGAAAAVGTWPSLLFFLFIVSSTLRLDFVLPAFTGTVAAVEYLGLVFALLPIDAASPEPVLVPIYHLSKSAVMLIAGVVAGLVAVRLRGKFRFAFAEATSRERVTNLFGQHVSPAEIGRAHV